MTESTETITVEQMEGGFRSVISGFNAAGITDLGGIKAVSTDLIQDNFTGEARVTRLTALDNVLNAGAGA